ncbi:hypothetical protein B1R94_05690 [Mycolicibacterium litorale]|nr:hypothetical protein B1R94_05690 [Mycolicibacterium litorale]
MALLGASVIAMSPLTPVMPEIQAMQRTVSSVGVQLSASVNPIENWLQVFQKSAANLGAIGQQIVDSPAPILSQIVANQIASLTTLQTALANSATNLRQIIESIPGAIDTARGQLQGGHIVDAFNTLNNTVVIPFALTALQAVSDSTVPLVNTVNNFAKAFATLPNAVFQVVLPMTFPLVSTINVAVQATQDVYDGVVASNPSAVINTLVNLPANLANGFLNGYGTILGFINSPGLLTPYDPDLGFLASGPISSLIALRDVIAQAIGATPPPTAGATAAAKTVTLSTAAAEVRSTPSARRALKAPESAAASTASAATDTAAEVDGTAGKPSTDGAESSAGSAVSVASGAKVTPAAAAADSAKGDSGSSSEAKAESSTGGGHESKAGTGKRGSAAKSVRSARAGK